MRRSPVLPFLQGGLGDPIRPFHKNKNYLMIRGFVTLMKGIPMKRRNFLTATATAAATAAAASAFPTPALAQGKKQLKMVTTWPKNFPGLGTSPERIAVKIREATDGEIDIKV